MAANLSEPVVLLLIAQIDALDRRSSHPTFVLDAQLRDAAPPRLDRRIALRSEEGFDGPCTARRECLNGDHVCNTPK
jgi:hypothetical protein